MVPTERPEDIHEARVLLQQLRQQHESGVLPSEDRLPAAPLHVSAECRANAREAAARYRCYVFRRRVGLAPYQWLMSNQGHVAALLDVSSDHLRIGLLKTGEEAVIPIESFKTFLK